MGLTKVTTSDGVEVSAGSRVFTIDMAWGTITAIDDEGWCTVKARNGTEATYNGTRLATVGKYPDSNPLVDGKARRSAVIPLPGKALVTHDAFVLPNGKQPVFDCERLDDSERLTPHFTKEQGFELITVLARLTRLPAIYDEARDAFCIAITPDALTYDPNWDEATDDADRLGDAGWNERYGNVDGLYCIGCGAWSWKRVDGLNVQDDERLVLAVETLAGAYVDGVKPTMTTAPSIAESAAPQPRVTLTLQIKATYDLNGTTTAALVQQLADAAKNIATSGLLIGGTTAIVTAYSHEVHDAQGIPL